MTQVRAIQVGVIGLGSIGMRHARNLVSMGHDVLAYDPSLQRRELFEQSGGKTVGDKQSICDSCEAVVIASPSSLHLEDLAWAAKNNMHVFIEKPLAHTMQGLEEISFIAENKKLVISLGMNMRFNPAVKHLLELIREGRIGDLLWTNYWHSSFLPDWRPGTDYRIGYAADPRTGGVIFDVIHGFDLIHFLNGAYSISGATACKSTILDIPSDACADVLCTHTSGVTSTLHMDFMTRPKSHTLTLAGANAVARVDITKRHFLLTSSNGNIVEDTYYADTTVNDDYCYELRDFISAIHGAKLEGCSLQEGMIVLSAVIEARKQAGLPSA